MTDTANTIEVENLIKRFGRVTAVNAISFTVRRGEIIGFLGPNGAGKSTTMRILTGYMPATSGIVRICGHAVAAEPQEIKRHIGYMPENNPLPEDLRVREYLRWRGRLKGLSGKRLRERIDAVLEQCDLTRAQTRIIGKLSKGYRQRVGVADAILAEPDVIIMDEPTIGLDPHQILLMRDLIASLRGRMSVIISSHILPEIEMTCDRVLIINSGHIVAQGTPAELRQELIQRLSYELEIQGDFALLETALTNLPAGARLERDTDTPAGADGFYRAKLELPLDQDRGEEVLARLVTQPGLRLRSFTRREATLEEVFLAATRRSWETITPLGHASDASEPDTPLSAEPEPKAASAPVAAAEVKPSENEAAKPAEPAAGPPPENDARQP